MCAFNCEKLFIIRIFFQSILYVYSLIYLNQHLQKQLHQHMVKVIGFPNKYE